MNVLNTNNNVKYKMSYIKCAILCNIKYTI